MLESEDLHIPAAAVAAPPEPREAPRPRRANRRGEKTRREILEHAVNLASAEGLEGLTIGRLAGDLHMSKSGLFAHFGSKEDLQLATVDMARTVFLEEVVQKAEARKAPRGLPRLMALLNAWLDYLAAPVFRGGCFFMAAGAEFDSRPGAVRSEIARLTRAWLAALEHELAEAAGRGQLKSRREPAQLAFEFHAFVQEANWLNQLFGDRKALGKAREAIRARLRKSATKKGKAALKGKNEISAGGGEKQIP